VTAPGRSTLSSALRFAVLSGASGVTNLGLTAFFHELAGLPEELSYALALACVIVQNFLGMRWFVYGGSTVPWRRQLVQFLASTAGFRGLEYLAFLLMVGPLRVHYLLAAGVNMVTFTIAKYVFYRGTVFSR
jgi:putative flippase GtrA